MLGIGPEWIRTNAYGIKTNSVGVEVAPDLMFWSSRKHRFGWYLEPSYEYKFGPGHEHSLGISGGLLRNSLEVVHSEGFAFLVTSGSTTRNPRGR